MRTSIFGTRFWTDISSKSIGIRSANNHTQPFECSLNKYWRLLGFKIYEDESEHQGVEYRLSFEILWFSLNMLLWTRKNQPVSFERSWGFYFMDRVELVMRWGKFYKGFSLPFITTVFVKHEILSRDRQRVVHDCAGDFKNEGGWNKLQIVEKENSSSFPYRYELLSGEVQDVIATVHAERWTRRWKWTPFKTVSESIDVKFSEEVGNQRGSWKGGCVGCGWTMLPKETIVQCLRRMERDRRFDR